MQGQGQGTGEGARMFTMQLEDLVVKKDKGHEALKRRTIENFCIQNNGASIQVQARRGEQQSQRSTQTVTHTKKGRRAARRRATQKCSKEEMN